MKPWLREAPTAALLIAMWAWTAAVWDRVPARMPVHWNLYGEVDGWGGRAEGLLIAPSIATAMTALLVVLPAITPKGEALVRSRGWWGMRTSLVAFFAFVDLVLVRAALGAPGAGTWIVLGAGLLMAAIGASMTDLEPNWIAGIRTPWTLSSKKAWDASHRVGGRAFAVVGLLTAGVAPVAGWVALPVLLVGLVVATAWSMQVAYTTWRDDPEKTS